MLILLQNISRNKCWTNVILNANIFNRATYNRKSFKMNHAWNVFFLNIKSVNWCRFFKQIAFGKYFFSSFRDVKFEIVCYLKALRCDCLDYCQCRYDVSVLKPINIYSANIEKDYLVNKTHFKFNISMSLIID